MKRIPLYAKNGSIRDYALVDDDDFDSVNAHRWYRDSYGYAVRSSPFDHNGRQRKIIMHREIMGLVQGDGLEVDHIDNDAKLDNRRSNLRIATNATNKQNISASGFKGSLSRFRGVNWNKSSGKWMARIHYDGKRHYLGLFETEEEAGRAAAEARAQHMPFSTS